MDILSCITLENGVDMTFTVKNNTLWFEMDEPKDKEMMVTIYEVLCDTHKDGLLGQENVYHHSELDKKYLTPGTYIFRFSNDQYNKLTVIFNHNKLSFEVC